MAEELDDSELREIGHLANWALSTAKPGNGVQHLRDNDMSTYWQSDGLNPHSIVISFPRRTTITAVALHMNSELDESYTPEHIVVMAGLSELDAETVADVEVEEKMGWLMIPLTSKRSESGVVKGTVVKIEIRRMQQHGRDTHLRQVRIYGPKPVGSDGAASKFRSPEFTAFDVIR